jgi:polysaccharide deacetylase family protein (PEP-CTERM system associated)
MTSPAATPRRHLLTVNLEDYFQVGAFNRFVQHRQWYRFESRLEVTAERALDLLDRYEAKATFFVLGWVADNYPGVVRKVAARGHEIASRGYYHRSVREITPDEFRKDLGRARAALEGVSGRAVVGYRTADGWFGPDDLWALDILGEEGYAYDSSLAPLGRQFRRDPLRRFVHDHKRPGRPLVEVPVSTTRVLGYDIPIGGGNWVRQLPAGLMRSAAARWDASAPTPLVLYFHTWELDDQQPRISTAGWLTRQRHYRNLGTMPAKIERYLADYRWTCVADHLRIDRPAVATRPDHDLTVTPPPMMPVTSSRNPVTIVVPVFNEELIVPYLANTLRRVRTTFAQTYETNFLIVDDGSTDRTWDQLSDTFRCQVDVKLIRHPANAGVAAAIRTGLSAAETEIVCSMDADCTYDPYEFLQMIPRLGPGVDLVTASPYHPHGAVRNVPGWRLALSKTASRLYRRVLHNKLHTYTSCFRVYRRSAVLDLPATHGNFLGVVELLGRLDLRGGTIVEHPATLDVRMLGRSKMKTLRTIGGHLRLLARFALARLTGKTGRRAEADAARDRALHLLFDTAQTPCHAALERRPASPAVTEQAGHPPPRGGRHCPEEAE